MAAYITVVEFDQPFGFNLSFADKVSYAPSLVKLLCFRKQIHESAKQVKYEKLNEEDESVFDKFSQVTTDAKHTVKRLCID